MKWDLTFGGTSVARGFTTPQVDLYKKVIKRGVLKGAWLELVDPTTQRGVRLFLSPGVAIGFIPQP